MVLSMTPTPTPPKLADFDFRKLLGRGKFGEVWLAWDLELDQPRAVKVVRAGALAAPAARERFEREAKAVARLDHPGVVRIHQLGEHTDVLFICMDYLPAGSLRHRLHTGPLGVQEAAELMVTHGIRRLPIFDGDRLMGIVTLDDLVLRTGDPELTHRLTTDITRAALPEFYFFDRGG